MRSLRRVTRRVPQPASKALAELERAASTWTLVTTHGPRAVEGPEANVHDDGQYMSPDLGAYQAWRAATFTRSQPSRWRSPAAWIIVCTYVVAYEGQFEVGVHYRYSIGRGCGYPAVFEYEGWIRGRDTERYGTFGPALGAAYLEALHIAEGTPDVQAQYPEVFEWDGVAFGPGQ
jgi:hypothetical protein